VFAVSSSLDKVYPSGHRAVQDVSFEVPPGAVTALVGPNGAGKTTVIKLMVGLERGGGTTLFDGQAYRTLPNPLRAVGVVLDLDTEHPARTARNHLTMLAAAVRADRSRVDDLLDTMGLRDAGDRRVSTFSHGMRQRLRLAGALLGTPRMLILDEPTNGLDPLGILWLRDFLRDFVVAGGSVLISSHALGEVGRLADHVVVMARGRVVAQGPTGEVARSGSATDALLVRTDDVPALETWLDRHRVAYERLATGQLRLRKAHELEVARICRDAGLLITEMHRPAPAIEDALFTLIAAAHA